MIRSVFMMFSLIGELFLLPARAVHSSRKMTRRCVVVNALLHVGWPATYGGPRTGGPAGIANPSAPPFRRQNDQYEGDVFSDVQVANRSQQSCSGSQPAPRGPTVKNPNPFWTVEVWVT